MTATSKLPPALIVTAAPLALQTSVPLVMEQLMFPEIDYDRIDKTRGLEVSFVTTARNDEEGRRLLQLLGMPFARTEA